MILKLAQKLERGFGSWEKMFFENKKHLMKWVVS